MTVIHWGILLLALLLVLVSFKNLIVGEVIMARPWEKRAVTGIPATVISLLHSIVALTLMMLGATGFYNMYVPTTTFFVTFLFSGLVFMGTGIFVRLYGERR